MKRTIALALVLIFSSLSLSGYPVYFKEQYYKLYHAHYIQYPDDTIENIYWLEQARNADFCNPLYALSKIEDERPWEKYRYLFNMHVNLKIIEQYLLLGSKWDKRVAYFYNAPWKEQNLESLKTAEQCYRTALVYWQAAKDWAAKAGEKKFRFIYLERVQFWEDEAARIAEDALNYERIVGRELERLEAVRAKFQAMDEKTY